MTATLSRPTNRRRSRTHRDSQTAKPVTHRLALVLALLLSLSLLYGGARLLLAGIAGYQAQAFLNDWASKGTEPSPHAWQVAHSAAQRAVDLYPGRNGEHLERLGRVLQWQQFRQPFGAADAEQSRRAALAAFRSAAEARPTWPYNWAALAYAKLYLLEFDGEFTHALQQASLLGPSRLEVNRSLAEIGFLAWPELDEAQRAATLDAARKTVNYSTKEAQNLLAVAAHTGMTAELCSSLDGAMKQKNRICQ